MTLPRQYLSALNSQFYWAAIVIWVMYRQYGWGVAVKCIVFAVDERYVYGERHSWTGTESEPVSAVMLIITLRQERQRIARELDRAREDYNIHRGRYDGGAVVDLPARAILSVRRPMVSPLLHHLENYWENPPPLVSARRQERIAV